jgi:hypothetical protein
MYSDNKQIRDVADVAARIMAGLPPIEEELKGGQVKLDKNHNGKIDGQDFKILKGQKKAEVKTEEIEHLDENHVESIAKKHGMEYHPSAYGANMSHAKKGFVNINRYGEWSHHKQGDKLTNRGHGTSTARGDSSDNFKGLDKHLSSLKEEYESIDEVKMADLPSRKVQGRSYGASKPEPHALDVMKGPTERQLGGANAEKKKKFSEMVNLYQDKGLKSLSEMLAKEETVEEGASEEEYNAQLDVAKFKANTKDDDGTMPVKQKTKMVAKASELAVKTEETHSTVEVIDLNDVNGVQYSEIELAQERTLTSAENDKKEEIVKSMKKGLAGFKDRYGDRAKSVMYATATANAKGE